MIFAVMMKCLNYSDVCLVPKYSTLKSRKEANVSVDFLGKKWNSPVIPANMKTTIDMTLAKELHDDGYFYILHRFYDYDLIFNWIKTNQDIYISISIGVQEKDIQLIEKAIQHKLRIDCITIDIAHSFSVLTKATIKKIRTLYGKKKCPYIIAGNVFGNADSIHFLEDECGVDAIKVGLAFGKACTTYNQTGFASPMFTCGLDASTTANVPIIGDGGIRENGDIVKGLVAGYTMIMAGSLFAACIDSPCEKEWTNAITYKAKYFGSASKENKEITTQPTKYIEGKTVYLEGNGYTYYGLYNCIRESLQSAISYAGGKDLSVLSNVSWIEHSGK